MRLRNALNLGLSSICGAAIGLGAAGCERTPSTSSARPTPSEPPRADNTARNTTDRRPGSVTPADQGENDTDRRITAEIRKAVVAQHLSVNAQNCKIITKDGVVTLRGPVESQAEKDFIAGAAQGVSGVRSVVNELEIKS